MLSAFTVKKSDNFQLIMLILVTLPIFIIIKYYIGGGPGIMLWIYSLHYCYKSVFIFYIKT